MTTPMVTTPMSLPSNKRKMKDSALQKATEAFRSLGEALSDLKTKKERISRKLKKKRKKDDEREYKELTAFMEKHGLGWEDMQNDITLPHHI